MRTRTIRLYILAALTLIVLTGLCFNIKAQRPKNSFSPTVPKTWDDEALAALEVPVANPLGLPRHVPADYYYRIPVRPIYKSYPVYAPGHEPAGYMEWLRQQEPVILWDDAHKPPLATEGDWIRAGELVFDSPLGYNFLATVADVRDPAWYEKTGTPLAKDGTMPVARYVIRKRGVVDLEGGTSCAGCHTRVMPDGSIVKGAQGNLSPPHLFAYRVRTTAAGASKEASQALARFRNMLKGFFATAWLQPDPGAIIGQMSADEIASRWANFPPGVSPRHRSSYLHPIQIPDLIGVKDRKYLDRTGLQPHRSIVDLMRYAALNQGGDNLADFSGFIPNGGPGFDKRPDPSTQGRYSDEQLYALALYIYSLRPPANPNKLGALATRGRKVFGREGCADCHTPPLYTSNELTPAQGFSVPEDHLKKYDILPVSVGTDAGLTINTRRGTGYYKVPSLKGVWYRGMFGHSGWCATLDDWFDPRRTRDDYVPTGYKPYGVKTYAVKGHRFGLNLAEGDRKALIAFLKTL